MKTLVLTATLLLATSPCLAQTGVGRIAIFSDVGMTDSKLVDISPRTANIYVAVIGSNGATGVTFRVAPAPGFTGVRLSEASSFQTVGSSPTSIAVGYGSCLVGDFVILTVTYQLFGTSSCSSLTISAPQGHTIPICTPCSFADVPCDGFDALQVNCTVPVESTTWGQIKALYRD
jgi:hypothetical protein